MSKADLSVSVCRIIEKSENEPGLKELAAKTGYSESYIQRTFKEIMGISPKEYAAQVKAEKLRSGLAQGSSITSSIYSAGYGSSSRVYGNLDSLLSMKPSQYKNSGDGVVFRSGIFPCSLGFVLIAFTEKGLAAVQLGDSEEQLRTEFANRFFRAEIQELETKDSQAVQSVLQKIEDPSIPIDIPLDIHGTIFQKKVWNALRQIPSGETRTYTEIAQQIGSPKSHRAVANACGKNELAVVIPCHRVIRGSGELSGYRWGTERKVKLLEKEQK